MRFVSHPETSGDSREALCRPIIAYLGVEYEPTHVVADAADYSDDHTLLDEFRDIAFSWTPERPRNRVPSYLVEVMSEPHCLYLIWLSRKALSLPRLLFTWVFAHELRHIYQSRQGFERNLLRQTVQKIRRTADFQSLPPSIFAPDEIDSELCALRVVETMFGEEELVAVLQSAPLPRYPYPAYLRFLRQLARDW